MGNPHMFETVSAYEMTKRSEAAGEDRVYNLTGFTVRKEHRLRFFKASANKSSGKDFATVSRNCTERM